MILILSQSQMEPSTDRVMDRIRDLGGRCIRLNGSDVSARQRVSVRESRDGTHLHLEVGGRPVARDEVRVVWYRRWTGTSLPTKEDFEPDPVLASKVQAHLKREHKALSTAIMSLFSEATWLSPPRRTRPNKLSVLRTAREAGLAVPETLVTTSRDDLLEFIDEHGEVVTKTVGDVADISSGDTAFHMYTGRLSRSRVESMPERFFPTLVQEAVEKRYEVRTFYLDGRLWSMAIFSQLDAQTSVDFRRYNHERPNRSVPYRLPASVRKRVVDLMEALDLKTGSLDFIRSDEGRYVFLEVNPVGQFGMVSDPCRYRLEKRVAEYLVRQDTSSAGRKYDEEALKPQS